MKTCSNRNCSVVLEPPKRKWCSDSCSKDQWQFENPEKGKQWRKDNVDKLRANRERHIFNNPDYALQRSEYEKGWREENPDYHKLYVKNWHTENPDKKAEYRHKRRLMINKSEGHFTAQDIVQMLISQDGLCAYCEDTLKTYHVDHMIPLSRGGSNDWDNIALACEHCNKTKGTKTVEEALEVGVF